jgi:hypothetical protein
MKSKKPEAQRIITAGSTGKWMKPRTSVVDPHHLDPHHFDPHHFDADPDSTYHLDADPDPDPSFKKKAQTLEKVLK